MAHLKETEIDGPTPNLVRNRRRRAYHFYATGVKKHRLGNKQSGTHPTLERAQGKLTTPTLKRAREKTVELGSGKTS